MEQNCFIYYVRLSLSSINVLFDYCLVRLMFCSIHVLLQFNVLVSKHMVELNINKSNINTTLSVNLFEKCLFLLYFVS